MATKHAAPKPQPVYDINTQADLLAKANQQTSGYIATLPAALSFEIVIKKSYNDNTGKHHTGNFAVLQVKARDLKPPDAILAELPLGSLPPTIATPAVINGQQVADKISAAVNTLTPQLIAPAVAAPPATAAQPVSTPQSPPAAGASNPLGFTYLDQSDYSYPSPYDPGQPMSKSPETSNQVGSPPDYIAPDGTKYYKANRYPRKPVVPKFPDEVFQVKEAYKFSNNPTVYIFENGLMRAVTSPLAYAKYYGQSVVPADGDLNKIHPIKAMPDLTPYTVPAYFFQGANIY